MAHDREVTHMLENARTIIMALWLAIGAVWLLTAFRLKPITQSSESSRRMWELLILTWAAVMLFSESPHIAALDARYLPAFPGLLGLGITLTAAGAVFTSWPGSISGRIGAQRRP
jgi:hypothetical protein